MGVGRPRRGEPWVVMQARRLGCGHNPLRRPSDRFEAALAVIALFAGILLIPVGAAVGTSVEKADESRVAEQRAVLRQLAARTTADAPAVTGQELGRITWPVPVVWQDETGVDHRGLVDLMLGTKANTEVVVWVDRSGALVKPPRTAGDSAAIGDAVGFGTVIGCWLVLWVLLLIARRALDRRRLADWAAEWEQVAPGWTHHDG
ncbi:Rv1733c family protein [Kribbella ginsengisoli]